MKQILVSYTVTFNIPYGVQTYFFVL